MRKECFSQEVVDVEKFRECATCPLSEECAAAVALKGARGAALFGQALGLLAGLGGVAGAALLYGVSPAGAGALLCLSLLYIASVLRAGKAYATESREEADALARRAEAK